MCVQDSYVDIAAEYNRMMNSLESDSTRVDSELISTETAPRVPEAGPPVKNKSCSDGSSSRSDSSSDDSGSEDESKANHGGKVKRGGSESTDYSSDVSSATGSGWCNSFSFSLLSLSTTHLHTAWNMVLNLTELFIIMQPVQFFR